MSNSISIGHDHAKTNKKHHFTMKDRIFFNKLAETFEEFKKNNSDYEKICELEERTIELITTYNR